MTTIVTAYYTIPSKQSNEKYLVWIKYFLELPCNMIIYTDEQNYEYIKQCRHNYINKTQVIVKPIEKFFVYRYLDYFKYCKEIDCEKYHSVDLYMIWNEKTFMTYEASIKNPFNSTYFLWTDMGCIRDKKLLRNVMKYPNETKIQKFLPQDKFMLSTIDPIKKTDYNHDQFKDGGYKLLKNLIQGGIMIGTVETLAKWKTLYENELNIFIENKWFIGKDQYVMTSAYIRDHENNEPFIKVRDARKNWLGFLNEFS